MEVYTSSNTEEMSTIFIWTGLANTVGTLLIGPLFDRINGMLLLAVCFLVKSASTALAPTWRSRIAFQILAAISNGLYLTIFTGK